MSDNQTGLHEQHGVDVPQPAHGRRASGKACLDSVSKASKALFSSIRFDWHFLCFCQIS